MDLKEYQTIIEQTAIYPKEIGLAYCALGLTGEAGEVSDKIKKLYRDKNLLINKYISSEDKESIIKEIGDVLWYCTALSAELGYDLEDALSINYNKLIDRSKRGIISGSGDER